MIKLKLVHLFWLLTLFLIICLFLSLHKFNYESPVTKFDTLVNKSNDMLINPMVSEDAKSSVLLILVTSHPKNEKQRNSIRNAWAKNKNISVYFSLGLVNNETLMDAVYNEGQEYNDMIVKNFTDTYDNLTKKTLSMLEWILENNMKNSYFLKTDDDNFINVPKLLEFLKTQNHSKKQIIGYLAQKWKPIRTKNSKYYLSPEMFKEKILPNFVTGPAYLMTMISVKDLYEESLKHNIIKLEDVFLTGIIANSLKIPRIHHYKFTNKFYLSHPKNVCYYFNIHRVNQLMQYHYFSLSQKCH